jgi:hypothetical protein
MTRAAPKRERKSFDSPIVARTDAPEKKYRVGPGCPPREFQFKPGQSGNPTGGKTKSSPIARNLKTALERALDAKITLKQGERQKTVTMAEAGIKQLVAGYAKGDRHARRDVIALASTLGVDLTAGQSEAIERALGMALPATDEALVEDFFQRRLAEHEQRRQHLDADFSAAELATQPGTE